MLNPDGTDPLELPAGVPFGMPSRDGRRAVSISNFPVMSVYRARAFPKAGEAVTAELALPSNRYEASPRFSPDGTKVALSSRRSVGGASLWVWDAAFRQGAPIFSQPSSTTGSPVWSPDGQRIAFDARVKSTAGDIWIVPATGGDAVQLTKDASEDIVPCFDPTGEWIYFTSNREASHQI